MINVIKSMLFWSPGEFRIAQRRHRRISLTSPLNDTHYGDNELSEPRQHQGFSHRRTMCPSRCHLYE